MIIFPPPCTQCGGQSQPQEVSCDQCDRRHSISGFNGVVVHFEDVEEECTKDHCHCEEDEDNSAEFHFCNLKCLSEYILDPEKDRFADYDERTTSVMVNKEEVATLLYALGRIDD